MTARESGRPLWTCPRCGAKLVSKNLWHSCGRATLDQWKARMRPKARALYDRFEQMIAACGEYHVAPAKTRIAFLARVRFAGITNLSEKGMTCTFALPFPLKSPRFVKVEEVVPGWWAHRLRITETAQLDEEVQAWLRESRRLMGMQERLIRNFDRDAAAWDDVPLRVKLAKDVAAAITNEVALTSEMDVLDFGCGTGLLTLRLQPFVGRITGADISQGMLDVLRTKIKQQKLRNVLIQLLDSERSDSARGRFDLIVSSMTLHHIREIGPLLDHLHSITAPSGRLCIADLDPDKGRFHDSTDGVYHLGFDRATLRRAILDSGFCDVADRTAAEVDKTGSDGRTRRFTVFLMMGRKK